MMENQDLIKTRRTDLSGLDAFMELPTSDEDTDQWLAQLIEGVNDIKRAMDHSQWIEWISRARSHPILSLLHKDPYHRRAFEKPRGYAGDAVMLDMIYFGNRGIPSSDRQCLCSNGKKIFDAFQRRESCESIRCPVMPFVSKHRNHIVRRKQRLAGEGAINFKGRGFEPTDQS